MTAIARAAALLTAAAACFAAAVLAGAGGAETQTAEAGPDPAVCCIYVIF